MKRGLIYVLLNEDDIRSEYARFLFDKLKVIMPDVLVVCSSKCTKKVIETVDADVSILSIEDGVFSSFTAFAAGIKFWGKSTILTLDEIICISSDMMGPFFSLNEMLAQMEKRSVLCWNLVKLKASESQDGILKDSFVAFRKELLHDVSVLEEISECYKDTISNSDAELAAGWLAKILESKDVITDAYVNAEELSYEGSDAMLYNPKLLLEVYHCPLVSSRILYLPYSKMVEYNMGRGILDFVSYVEKSTDYNVDMIRSHMLKTLNTETIKQELQLNYIFPKDSVIVPSGKEPLKTALIIHSYYEDLIPYTYAYAKSMPCNSDIYVTTDSPEKKVLIESTFISGNFNYFEVRVIQNRGRDVGALLTGCADILPRYDLICFVHDKKALQIEQSYHGENFSYKCFENLLGSQAYVQNIINTFSKEARLGMLMPAPPNVGHYQRTLISVWTENYEKSVELAEKLGLVVPIEKEAEPITPIGTMFWFRPCAIQLLLDQNYKFEDYPLEPNSIDGSFLHLIERIYGYTAQFHGYYCGWTFTDEGARIELTNLYYMLHTQLKSGEVANLLKGYFYDVNQIAQVRWHVILRVKIRHFLPAPIVHLIRAFLHRIKRRQSVN